MGKKRLLWKIYSSYLLLTAVAVGLAIAYAHQTLEAVQRQDRANDLEARARLCLQLMHPYLRGGDAAEADDLCKRLGTTSGTRITVVREDGSVLADSAEDPRRMDNHGDRPEIIAASRGSRGVAIRYSNTLKLPMMYVALPVREGTRHLGVLRTALPFASLQARLAALTWQIAGGGLVVAVVAALVGFLVTRSLTQPLEQLTAAAKRFSEGDLSFRLPLPGTREVAALSAAMNQMSARLDERIRHITQQRQEQDAILASMVEGVLAIDNEGSVLTVNARATALFDVDPEGVLGRDLREVLRNPELLRFVNTALTCQDVVEGEIVLPHEEDRCAQVRATRLRDADGQALGLLLVLNEITEIKRLEAIRRDFVANVSHELRTPITSIKGFVETLLNGALEQPEEAQRFLGIVARQADRLNAIIEDLLSLSRVQTGLEEETVELQRAPVLPVLEAAVQTCNTHTREKAVPLTIVCKPDVRARINAHLLEQALVNLISNAINYSESGQEVLIRVDADSATVRIHVIDRGVGIEKRHLPRLFERFYRVDKARSRDLGGTGLGLAIVKHIALAHNGEVSVESQLGKGSTFTISLPAC